MNRQVQRQLLYSSSFSLVKKVSIGRRETTRTGRGAVFFKKLFDIASSSQVYRSNKSNIE